MTASSLPPSATGLGRQGWILVLTLASAQLVSWGSLFYSFSLFVVPMEQDLGWSRASINGALSIGLLVSGLAALPVGIAIDRGRARLVMTVGSLLGATVLAFGSSDMTAGQTAFPLAINLNAQLLGNNFLNAFFDAAHIVSLLCS